MNSTMTWGGAPRRFKFYFPNRNINNVEACEILRCERLLLAGSIVCVTGPWSRIKISLNLCRYRVRKIKMVAVKMLKTSRTMIIDDWEQVCEI